MHRQTIFKRIDQQANILEANTYSKIFAEAVDDEHKRLRERLEQNQVIDACKVYLSADDMGKSVKREALDQTFLHLKFAINAYTSKFLDIEADKFLDVIAIDAELKKKTPSLNKLVEHYELLKLAISAETRNVKFNMAKRNIAALETQVKTEIATRKYCNLL